MMDTLEITMGPLCSAFSQPFRLSAKVDGNLVRSAKVESGFCFKDIETLIESSPWTRSTLIAGKLDNENALFTELAFCLAAESIAEIEVPKRTKMIRVLISELARISSHLKTLAEIAKQCGSEAGMHMLLRDREKLLDLFELLTGARFSHAFFVFGGMRYEVSEGFLEKALEQCRELRNHLAEYNHFFTFHVSFLKRAAGLGRIDLETIRKFGITGPNARASGTYDDIRKTKPYSAYSALDFMVPSGLGEFGERGDTHERVTLRIRELLQSMDLVAQAVQKIPPLPKRDEDDDDLPVLPHFPSLPEGEAFVQVETPRGAQGCYIVSDGGDKPSRVQFHPASLATFEALPEILEGVPLQDVGLVLASLNLSLSEIDG